MSPTSSRTTRSKRLPASRFRDHYVEDPGGCWLWTGAIAADTGYGIFRRDQGKLVLAHVFSWELLHPGVSRAGKVVRHTCDVRNCVNPEHLELGTHADNSADMDARGRRVNNPKRGEDHYRAKLTYAMVEKAKQMRSAGTSVAVIARIFRVSTRTISSALEGKTWKDPPP